MISLFRGVIHSPHRHRLCRRIAEVEDRGRGKIYPVATDFALGIGRDGDLHRTGGQRIECDGIRIDCSVFTHRGSPIGLGKGDARHIVVRNDCSHRIDRHAGGIICRVPRVGDDVTNRARVIAFLAAVIDCPHGDCLGGCVGSTEDGRRRKIHAIDTHFALRIGTHGDFYFGRGHRLQR